MAFITLVAVAVPVGRRSGGVEHCSRAGRADGRVVTRPFSFEGDRRRRNAEYGINNYPEQLIP